MKKIIEGKTKIIWEDSNANEVLIESKDDITAGDGAKRDSMKDKGILSTETTCNCFRLLNVAGIVTHFIERVDKKVFRARRAQMIPIELVARRIATGSYLKRNPEVKEGTIFEPIKTEFFLKDDARHDPFMLWNERKAFFELYDAKKSLSAGPFRVLWAENIIPGKKVGWWRKAVPELTNFTQKVFLILEQAWSKQDVVLVDLKIECGIDAETGQLLLADVIDNDSWRIWPQGDKAQMMDKQVYRNLEHTTPEALDAIKKNYAWVTQATAKFTD